ncbi:F-box/FBD/LRR-repeat protein At1g78750-like [Chenopodium quinoa]|uniref:F-box/FBD/LRR-repeat protein At1g78750-like n=1 Tax=Chenopodium quinoa TaxID=63459 RepID=UPI000B78D1B3|nr:F-box/FBD/LRR-repeat protein At1g78750-like [Chenopodium quinoa]XP_021749769.1 F-box/FBD/LRR-repeat protein At1g78750-like [Chenopodium quinoa]
MEKRVNLEKNLDRISDLPEPIRRHILSFLPADAAVRSSILSRSWQGLWTELPKLKLSEYQLKFQFRRSLMVKKLPKGMNDGARVKREAILREREAFYGFLDRALESSSDFKKLDLYVFGYRLELESRLDHWLECVVRRRIKVLKLHFSSRKKPRYCLPKIVLGADSLTKLHLQKCELNSSRFVDAQLPSLREIDLEYVYMDDGVIGSLAAVCPNLEVLDVISCRGLTRFVVSGLNKLLTIEFETSADVIELIEIEAPNLLEFFYINDRDIDAQACAIKVLACPKMRRLRLHGAQLGDVVFKQILENLFVLEKLVLYCCNLLEHVSVSNQNLIQVQFSCCGCIKMVEIDAPNLKSFHYSNGELMTIKPKGCALKLTKASIFIKPNIRGDNWYACFIKFLAELRHCENLQLRVETGEEFLIPESVRMESCPPLHGVKNLVVQLRSSLLKYTQVELVQALLWLAPCLESLTINNDSIPVCKFLKFTYEKPVEGKNCGCWKHALTEVSLENRSGDEDDTKLATFFSKARVDGKTVCFVKNVRPGWYLR